MYWFFLLLAGLFEIGWAVGLKFTEGFTKLIPSTFTLIAMVFSLWFLSLSLKAIPIGTAYGIWTGIGTFGTALFGILYYGESTSILRIISFVLILAGIAGLKLSHN
ncbi:MAG: QacE family quaternary ammonium compound efflux SMR transporter [Chlamydia sp. 32-24]|nr:MAG: QacE family quaternary ammonium compound efflux SMR transporter [Chlamydia sp. 32-24]